MADINLNDIPEDLEALAKELPEDINMDELIQNITKMALQFVQEQGSKPMQTQILIFFGFLLIPLSLMLFCFCKLLSSHKKRQGKEKKKQKEQKKETKKDTKKDTKKESKKKA